MSIFSYNDSYAHSCVINETIITGSYRLFLVGGLGTTTAVVSIIENGILFYVFSTSRKLRRQNYANPVLLSLFDIIVSMCYIALMSTYVLSLAYESIWMIRAWHKYVRLVYCIQHIALTTSNFLLVIASIERYLANSSKSTQKRILVLLVHHKRSVFVAIFALSLLFKATLYFETTIIILEHCPIMESILTIWVSSGYAGDIIRFWMRKLFTIIFPFIVLAFCNWQIVVQLRQRRSAWKNSIRREIMRRSMRKKGTSAASDRKRYMERKGVRIATRTLVMVVGCYLISNLTTTVISTWEFLDGSTLRYEHFYAYLIASDIAALLAIVGCALRLPIYAINDRRIRKAIFRAFLRCRYRRIERLKEAAIDNLEKWSIVIVSNSLRSNLTAATGMHPSQENCPIRCRKSLDELAFLLQCRRRLIVDMTFTLTAERKRKAHSDESVTVDDSFLTDIQEEEVEPLHRAFSKAYPSINSCHQTLPH
ncbi:hypothetical protein Tcan_17892 [Toxocara canis]|uniref:G-protein coupled receptors family 1 profile domain-containing protein n=1 Tax=Toxocara canis TaxID=6265 RepID=A0A0B2UXT5_TOXCA|nr:hypothetical protein Tcan_17892 [Toxocara canis]